MSRSPPAASASRAAATATCARSTSRRGKLLVEVPDRPADRLRRRRSTPWTARSTWRSRSAARRRRRTAACFPGSWSSRSAATRRSSRRRPTCRRSAPCRAPRLRGRWSSRPRAWPHRARPRSRRGARRSPRPPRPGSRSRARSSSGRGTRTRRTSQFAFGKVFLGKSPVSGAQIRVDGFTLPALDRPAGRLLVSGRHHRRRHATRSRSSASSRAKVRGHKLTTAQQNALQERARRDHRGLPHEQLARESAVERKRPRHGPRHELRRRGASGGRSLHVQAQRHDHRRRGQAGPGRSGGRPHERPRLLDVLVADGCGRPLHVAVPRVGRARRGSGSDQHRRCARPDVVRRQPRHRRELQAQPERDTRHPAPRGNGIHASRSRTRTPARSTRARPSASRTPAASSSRSRRTGPTRKATSR